MCVYIYMYIYACKLIYTFIFIYIYIYIYQCTLMYTGISEYKRGNDMRYIALRSSALVADPVALGYTHLTQGSFVCL